MPLKPGKSPQTLSKNISELLGSWKSTGHIGTSIPNTKSKAQRQAIAIAYKKRGEGK